MPLRETIRVARSAAHGRPATWSAIASGVVRRGIAGRPGLAHAHADSFAAGGVESLKSRLLRYRFNWYPCYRRTGARLTFVAADLREVRVKLPLNRRTRGYWGATFGGSVYGALDPVLLVMLARNLGPGYMVWDKSATIEFKKPGRSTLYATFRLEAGELGRIKAELERAPRVLRSYTVELVDRRGIVHASCTKTLHIRRARSRARPGPEPMQATVPSMEKVPCRAKTPASAPR